jgi:hypothetical protein
MRSVTVCARVCLLTVSPETARPCEAGAQLAEPALAVFGGYLVFWYAFACSANLVSQRMDHSDPSYGLYLYAWPVQNLLIFYIPGISPLSVTAITLPVALMLGLLSWQLVEKPALRHKNLFGHSKSKLAGTRTPYVRETS